MPTRKEMNQRLEAKLAELNAPSIKAQKEKKELEHKAAQERAEIAEKQAQEQAEIAKINAEKQAEINAVLKSSMKEIIKKSGVRLG